MIIKNEEQYEEAVAELDDLLDTDSETMEVTSRIVELSNAIEEYDDRTDPWPGD